MSGGDKVTPSSPRYVHIVDATKGPLIGDGRFRRVMPFAATATICMIVAVATTSWTRPGFAIAGSALSAATIVGALWVPWRRFARAAQLTSPMLFLVATLLLASASGNGVGSPFITMAVLPMVWLALYENRAAVLFAAGLTGVALWLVVPGENGAPIRSLGCRDHRVRRLWRGYGSHIAGPRCGRPRAGSCVA